jgi:hypothetical protein
MTADLQNENGLRGLEAVRKFLKTMEMDAEEKDLPSGKALMVELDGPAKQAVLQVNVEAQRFVVNFIFDGYVPAEKRISVAEFITRANWGLIEGNFELNFDDGALRYKVGLDFSSCELTDVWIRNCMLNGMDSIEMFAQSLNEVVVGITDPETANRESRELA